jgi:hypothetical protein
MAKEPEKLHGIFAPTRDAETYFSQGSMIFLQKSPNHTERREEILKRIEIARQKLPMLEEILATSESTHHAVARFLLEALCGIKASPSDVEDLVFFREKAPQLSVVPAWVRTRFMGANDRACVAIRSRLMDRLTADGLPFADSFFDAIWFNANTVHVYPDLALVEARKEPDLMKAIQSELTQSPLNRPKTRALLMEVMRLKSRIASVNFFDQGKLKFGLIVTGVMDPARYPNPEKIDLNRDHSDSLTFALPSQNRSCPGHDLAPEMMACILAHQVRSQANNN